MNDKDRAIAMDQAGYEIEEIKETLQGQKKKEDDVYITIGVPFSNIPIMQKVHTYVDLTVKSYVQAAKELRKQVADDIEKYGWIKGPNFTPAELYFEIYPGVDSAVPFAMSFNSPYRKAHIHGRRTS